MSECGGKGWGELGYLLCDGHGVLDFIFVDRRDTMGGRLYFDSLIFSGLSYY